MCMINPNILPDLYLWYHANILELVALVVHLQLKLLFTSLLERTLGGNNSITQIFCTNIGSVSRENIVAENPSFRPDLLLDVCCTMSNIYVLRIYNLIADNILCFLYLSWCSCVSYFNARCQTKKILNTCS